MSWRTLPVPPRFFSEVSRADQLEVTSLKGPFDQFYSPLILFGALSEADHFPQKQANNKKLRTNE